MSRTSATDNIDPRRQAIATRMFREHSQSARLIYGLLEEVPVDNKLGQRFDATSCYSVEVIAAYLNPGEQVHKLRTALG